MIIREMCLRSCAGYSDALVVDHDAKFTSEVFRAFVKSMGSCLVVGSAYHKNTNAKVERANGVISDTLCAYANGHKDDWDNHLTPAEFAINNTAWRRLDSFLHRPRRTPPCPLSLPHPVSHSRRLTVVGGLRAADACDRSVSTGAARRIPRPAAQADRKESSALSTQCSRSETACCCGPRSCSTPPTLVSCASVGLSLHGARLPEPQRLHPRAATSHALQPDHQRRPPQTLL